MSKILIIDDDPNNREILRARLEKSGHEVTEAPNGAEGLRLAEAQAPDLVLLDVMMPRMDGWEVCRRMKGNPKTKPIPVVMLTALGQEIDQMRGYESGANDYLTKPWAPEELSAVLAKHLASSGRA